MAFRQCPDNVSETTYFVSCGTQNLNSVNVQITITIQQECLTEISHNHNHNHTHIYIAPLRGGFRGAHSLNAKLKKLKT